MKEKVKISDYLFFQEGPGVRNTQYTTSGVKLLNVSNLVDGEIDLSNSDRYISNEEAHGKYKHFLVDEGDLIIASSGIKVDYLDKKVGFIKKEHLPLCMNTSTIRFKALDSKALNIKYFKYYLQSNDFKYQVSKSITGSAQLNYGPSHLKQMTFIKYDVDEQNKIVERLDKINNIIQKYKIVMNYLDTLIKARFVEMFGNVNNNLFKYNIKSLDDISEEIFAGGDKPLNVLEKPDKKHIYPVYANGYENEGLQGYSDMNRVNKDALTISARGTIGYCFVRKANFTPIVRLITIVPKNKVNLYFLKYQIDSIGVKSSGTSQAQLTVPDLKKEKILVPPIELQNQFATFVKQIDKLKFVLFCSIISIIKRV